MSNEQNKCNSPESNNGEHKWVRDVDPPVKRTFAGIDKPEPSYYCDYINCGVWKQ